MEIRFNQLVTGFEGVAFKLPVPPGDDGKPKDPEQATLRAVAIQALCGPTDERGLSGDEKCKRAALGYRLYSQSDPVELTPAEAAYIAERIDATFPNPVVVWRCRQLLDPATPEPPASGTDA